MTTVLRRVAATAAAAAVLLAVVACDPGDDPTDPPTESSDETTSEDVATDEVTTEPATAVPTPPEVEAPTPDPGASVDDHRGAILAAEYFFALYTYMRTTGDTAQFEAMSAAECEFCTSSVANAEAIHDGGGWAEGGEITLDRDEATADYPTDTEPNYVVRSTLTQEASTVHAGDGSSEELPVGNYRGAIGLRYVDGQFVAVGVNLESL